MACTQWPQPEQDSQANRTWSNIVENPTKQHCSENKVIFDSQVAEEYIPLNCGANGGDLLNSNGSKDGKQLKRKLPNNDKAQQSNNSHISTSDPYCTPWKTKNYIQNPTGLNEEIHDFLNYIKPRPEEDAIRNDVVERVRAVIKQLWPQAKVELYGSCQTGLYLPTSDIDLVVHGKWERLPLRTLENELIEQEIADANSIRVLDKATVPIIKVTDTKTQVKIDISFNMNNGVQSADMIKSYMEQYPALPYLTFVLKQFLVDRDLNEVFSGGISSYTVVLMIVSFFQHSEHVKSTDKDFNPSMDKDINLGVLLIEFFELYGKKFNYNNVGIRLVGSGSYFHKENELGKSLANETHLCIEDPLTQGNYIGKGSFRINDVKRAFEWACSVLTHGVLNQIPGNESSSILGRITRIRREAIEQRERMLRLSPCISPNIPSYASVATRNKTQSTTIRSIRDSQADFNAKPEANGTLHCSKSRENDKKNHTDSKNRRSSASSTRLDSRTTDTDWRKDRTASSSTSRTKDSQRDIDWKKNGQRSREKPHNRKNHSERTSSSSREKERTLYSPNHKHSPRRSSSTNVTESCGMRNNKAVKSITEIHQRPEKVLC
ncbi:non-canonical poly(A) RNA polymerase PAPD5-like [Paramuricea clavata]|uniref:polynucleotide adenylyltransferase n=1 Tax=Paramuricea clavata TaxID=317549 RepID=A0A7D9HLS9_PARCT|nr:non-canonical poly(A) RNA polymerase PAPD5-like [Paramuricea clavata]